MKTSFQYQLTFLTILSLACLYGCGKPSVHTVEVKGAVTLDGKPLDCGSIKFISDTGDTPSGGGSIFKDGTYKALVPPGEKKVLVTSYKVIGQEPVYPGMPDSPMQEKRKSILPGIYNATHRTPLEANITDKPNKLNFELHTNIENQIGNI